eukprot:GEZU01035693.1.p1 GENE.GEZU01035693.1~~GEZU01035693.1.p1  ORF type:complete len:128 (-),score=30.21 GEZU01035693.1:27-410(-)
MNVKANVFPMLKEFRKLKPGRTFFPTRVVMSAIAHLGNPTRKEIWQAVQTQGIKSKTHLTRILHILQDQGRITTVAPFILKHKKKNEFMYKITPTEAAFRRRMEERERREQEQSAASDNNNNNSNQA